jgi:uncharacterized protein YbjT (DUF2867 family)
MVRRMKILVTGGTGKIGRATVSGLRAAGHEAVPASRGEEGGVALDLHDVDAVERAAAGHDAALLIMPIGAEEEALGPKLVRALARAGVARIVAIGIHNAFEMREIPHFAAKLPMQAAVVEAGGTVLACNWFQQNDLNILPLILGAGVYGLPVGDAGVWAVDTDDIAAAAVNALTSEGWAGRTVAVCGPERLTGPDFAAHWERALGRPVRYAGNDIDPFIQGMKAAFPYVDEWVENDFRIMLRVTQSYGCPATSAEVAEAERIVGRPLARHQDFAVRLAAAQQRSPA